MGARFAVVCAAVLTTALSTAQAAQSPITLDASPRVYGGQPIDLRGHVAGGQNGDIVRITARDCGLTVFRLLFETHVEQGGSFSGHVGASVRTDFRAEWKGQVSAPVTVHSRPSLRLKQVSRRRFVVEAVALRYFRQKEFQLQRFTGSRWLTIKRARFVRAFHAGQVLWTVGNVVATVGKGTTLRVVLPRTQTGPCYLAGISKILRVSR